MADYSDPKRATAYRFTVSLFARSDNQIKTVPTLAAGDVKVSKDNGATANITTLPVETPASSGILQVDLSGTEMTADLVTVIFRDAAGAEWNDVAVNIMPSPVQMGDLATAANLAVVDTVVDSILVDTAEIGAAGAGLTALATQASVNTIDDFIDTEVAAIKAKTDLIFDDAVRRGTAQAGGGSTITLDASASATDDLYNDHLVYIDGGTGAGQARRITDYVGATKVATIQTAWVTNPDNTSTFVILPFNALAADVRRWQGTLVTTPTTAGVPKVEVVDIDAAGQTDIRAAVGMASADLDTQIDTLSTLDAAGVRTAVGLASANLDTQLAQLSSDVGDLEVLTAIYEGTETLQDFFRLARAALLGKASGLGTSAVAFRDAGDTKDRITATVDASGNRSVVTLDPD